MACVFPYKLRFPIAGASSPPQTMPARPRSVFTSSCSGWAFNFGDLDNDVWLDFYVGTGTPDLAFPMLKKMFRM